MRRRSSGLPPSFQRRLGRKGRRPWGLRARLGRAFALTALLAVVLTTSMTVGTTLRVLADFRPDTAAPLTTAEWDLLVRNAGHTIMGGAVRAALVSTLLSTVVAALVTRQLTWPLRRLADAAQRLQAGARDVALPMPPRQDEVGAVTRAFNDLTLSLARQEAWRRGLVADIAHDLRTPLAVLRSEIEAMQDGVQPVDSAALARLHGEVLLLARLVTDLRLLSLAESGALTLKPEVVDAGEVLRTLADTYARQAADVGVTLTVQTGGPVPVQADPDRLRQTLQNLLDNALRYAAPGPVELRAALQGGQGLLSVRDHGPGFSPSALSRAFERFYRADASRTRDPQGRASSGLGLAIARALTDAQGGQLDARNHPEGGAEFTVRLPGA
ncbi:HAMP domain-containing protein [Deinococcus sp. HMF7620]|uniref:histidine kinase n=1 Tax=Deinococcus arboris TaxID=2682977 RepID=A0A7C9IB13_9DEIO|nr:MULTISPECIES: ATP-binding protein [Deinococcus]MBZ9749861.1 HAMP domain-containing protein [Deinococcus betulae]MVN87086.1 HAMP domain-containing protein [Deinococcus arboris]